MNFGYPTSSFSLCESRPIDEAASAALRKCDTALRAIARRPSSRTVSLGDVKRWGSIKHFRNVKPTSRPFVDYEFRQQNVGDVVDCVEQESS
jgi:hypothetical protein